MYTPTLLMADTELVLDYWQYVRTRTYIFVLNLSKWRIFTQFLQ